MPSLEYVAVLQTSGGTQSDPGNPPSAIYAVFTIVAVMLGIVVWGLILGRARRSSKRYEKPPLE